MDRDSTAAYLNKACHYLQSPTRLKYAIGEGEQTFMSQRGQIVYIDVVVLTQTLNRP
jgi:hypothetical protein